MTSVIRWFIQHRVAANLAMLCILVLGFTSIPRLQQELIPNVALDRISIQTQFAGASAENVEQFVCTPLENAIHNIGQTEELISWSYPGLCSVTLDISEGADANAVVADIRSRLADPGLLPAQAETPDIQLLNVRNRAVRLIISGHVDSSDLISEAQQLRSELLSQTSISSVDLQDREKPEIRILFSLSDLEKYPLNLNQIAQDLRRQTASAAGGLLQTSDGNVLISSEQSLNRAGDFARLPLHQYGVNTGLLTGDVARIQDTRHQAAPMAWLDGKPALAIDIYRTGAEDITAISAAVQTVLNRHQPAAGTAVTLWQDEAVNFSERLNLLLNNAASGLLLLFIVLLLFLNTQLSFWVSCGILVSFVGTLLILPATNTSVNFISLFAFILVLGIVVDDAVVVGEAIHSRQESGLDGQKAALAGTLDVYRPVLFSVITTITAFLPLLFLPGPEGMLIKAVPIVVITTLLFSLFESLCILPAHLSHGRTVKKSSKAQRVFSRLLQATLQRIYLPLLRLTLANPWPVIALFLATFLLSLLLIRQGWIHSALFSTIEGDEVVATVTFPQGSPRAVTERALHQLNEAALRVEQQNLASYGPMLLHRYQVVGPNLLPSDQKVVNSAEHTGQIRLALPPAAQRNFSGHDVIRLWRAEVGDITGVDNVEYSASVNPTKADIQIEFSGQDQQQLNLAAQRLSDYLQGFSGIYSLQRQPDNNALQLNLQLKPQAVQAGIRRDEVMAQVNQAFYGQRVYRFFDHDDEVEVRTRLNDHERSSAWYLDNLPISYGPAAGDTVALKNIAALSVTSVNPYIRHFMRTPVVMVSAYVDATRNNAEQIKQILASGALDQMLADLPGVHWDVGGYQRAVQFFLDTLAHYYLLAILVMYLLMAVLFASYSQPLIVLFAIPFGLLGSVAGHLLLGLDLTLWSYVGMVAVSGVVVNDNLVLLDGINGYRAQGKSLTDAILAAGDSRFRPILLTSLTTFAGVLPLISETSVQAQLLIPMAVSLGFGVIFATIISLLLVPALCMVRGVEIQQTELSVRHG
ncbi:efflux RND transporter permease subunit [Thalassolituus sp. LLYu03]|uniref:efflux RND transporter permease subunit n=1 Tax=Thalassolituus sp. LLYu03 TaxID=3421656 RepID=UPI003D26FE19